MLRVLNTIEHDWIHSVLKPLGFKKQNTRWLHQTSARVLFVQLATRTQTSDPLQSTLVRIDWGFFTPEFAAEAWPCHSKHTASTRFAVSWRPLVEYAGNEVTWLIWQSRPEQLERITWPCAPEIPQPEYGNEVRQHLERVIAHYVPGPSGKREFYEWAIQEASTGRLLLNPTSLKVPLRILESLLDR